MVDNSGEYSRGANTQLSDYTRTSVEPSQSHTADIAARLITKKTGYMRYFEVDVIVSMKIYSSDEVEAKMYAGSHIASIVKPYKCKPSATKEISEHQIK